MFLSFNSKNIGNMFITLLISPMVLTVISAHITQ